MTRPLVAAPLVFLFACAGGQGDPGVPGAAGPGYLLRTAVETPGSFCAAGGTRVEGGADDDGDRTLDDAEVDTVVYVCDGADALPLTTAPEPPGTNCAEGGVAVTSPGGATTWICSGVTGQEGDSATVTPEPPGANCALGGVRLQVGTGPASYACSGAPLGTTLPTVVTVGVAAVRYVSATIDADVTDDGSELIFARGVVLADHAAPTLHDAVYFSAPGTGPFTTSCGPLAPATTYYVRPFATNALGTSYGEERSFSTLALTVPTISTRAPANVTDSTAFSGGDVADDGGSPILTRGVCWSSSPDPTTADACAAEGAGAGGFAALMTGLPSNTSLHVRAYATNALGTGYGDDHPFTTGSLPLATVTTAQVAGVSYTTASGGGAVVDDHGAPVSSRGICWATTPAPALGGACFAESGGLGSFTAPLAGLAPSTTYFVRAFAVNGGGASYGSEVSFTTTPPSAPVLTTKAVSGISSNVAGSGGVVSVDGGSSVTARGVCWSVNPAPTLANAHTSDGAGAGAFNSTLTGLNPLTTYFVRAYATNALGTGYGNEVSFTTTDLVFPGPTVPVVGTSPSTVTGSSTGASGGYVSNDGGSPVTARGVCWSTSPNPTLVDSCSTDGGAGVGYFGSTITGLGGCGVVYYVRAWATNATGTGYGNQNTLSTGLLPIVSTAAVSSIGYYGATSGGSVVDDGGCAITQRGVVWSWNPDPTTANSRTTEGAGAAPFVSSLSALYGNRTYYLRAYATNSAGTGYGQQEVFVTAEPPTPYLGQSYAGGVVFYVDGTGQHGFVAAPADQGRFSWGCDGTSIPTGTALGTGAANTAAIVAACSQAGSAARVADDLLLNGYGDWFLPSRDELLLMYANLHAQGLGGFGNDNYWTSSEVSASQAWYVAFWAGQAGVYPKYPTPPMRVARAF